MWPKDNSTPPDLARTLLRRNWKCHGMTARNEPDGGGNQREYRNGEIHANRPARQDALILRLRVTATKGKDNAEGFLCPSGTP